MATLSLSGGKADIKAITITTQTYNLLRSAILRHELKENEIYSQDQIGEMLNISRTPVREALLALQKEGYIRFLRGRGFEVVPMDESDLNDIYEVRYIIEGAAAGLAAKRANDEHLALLKDNIDEQKRVYLSMSEEMIDRYLQLDDEFHKLIFEACGNKRLANVIQETRNQLLRTGILILQFEENRGEIYQEHLSVYEAIANRQTAIAEKAMAEHLTNSRSRNKMRTEH